MRSTKTLASLLAGVLLASGAALSTPANAEPPANPTHVADQSDTAPVPATLRPELRRVVRAGAVGVSAQVVDRGEVWRGAAGAARLRPNRPAVPSAHFRAASVTKTLTAVLALQQVQRGRWTMDTTIGDVLPGLWPARSDVTVAQLLSHRSGAPDYLSVLTSRGTTVPKLLRIISNRRTDRALVRVAKRQDWLFEPGTGFSYSNTNYVIIGLMLRRATGFSLPKLAQRRIFAPARMTRSSWPFAKGFPAPKLREYAAFGKRRIDLSTFSPTMFSAAGALVTTARDLNRFQRSLSRGDLLAPRLVRLMRSVVTPAEETGLGVAYGYGSYRLPDPCRNGGSLHGHDGASFGTQTLSFTSGNGRRRVTVAMTGRQYGNPEQPAFAALNEFLVAAFASSCRLGPDQDGERGLLDSVDRVVPGFVAR